MLLEQLNKLPDLGVFLTILSLTVLIEWVSRRAMVRFLRFQAIANNSDPTSYKYFSHILTALVYSVGTIMAIREYPPLHNFASSLLTGASILAVAVGFASQQVLGNLISGFFIVIFRPFRVNDRLRIRDKYYGIVEDITLRHTVIRDGDNRQIIIPNSLIGNEILVNADIDDAINRTVDYFIAPQADLEKAKKIIFEVITKHPSIITKPKEEGEETTNDDREEKPLTTVRVTAITPNDIKLSASFWAKNTAESFEMYCDVLEGIKKGMDKAGIAPPLPNGITPAV